MEIVEANTADITANPRQVKASKLHDSEHSPGHTHRSRIG